MLGSRAIGSRWLGSGRAQRDDYVELSASLEVGGELAGEQPTRGRALSASVEATSDLGTDVKRIRDMSASLEATSDLSADLVRRRGLSASLPGAASLEGAVGRQRPLSATLESSTELTAQTNRARGLSASLKASGNLSAPQPSRLRALAAKFVATALMSAPVGAGRRLSAAFRAAANLIAGVRVNIYPSPIGRRLFVPPKRRFLPVPLKDRVVRFDGDDRDLSLKEREMREGEVVDWHFHLDRWFRSFPQDRVAEVEANAPAGITVDANPEVTGPYRFAVWVSGGQAGEEYFISLLVSTRRGRREKIDFLIRVIADG